MKSPDQIGAEHTYAGSWWPASRVLIVLAFLAGIAAYVVWSWHWPLIHDMQVIHYVAFLIDRGWSPYRQIHDMNMPGAYLVEGWALHLFGPTDFGWRLYDFFLCAVLIAAMIGIARRYDWLAGLVAGGTFVLIHASEGAFNAGQRDQVMATLLMVGCAFCFASVRRRMAWLMLPFALAVALAASIKPTLVPLGPLLLFLAAREARREGRKALPSVLWGLLGFAMVTALVLHFLIAHNSLSTFWFDLTEVLPHYATQGAGSWAYLLRATLQVPVLAYALIAAALFFLDRRWRNWEVTALWCGVFFGLVNFYGQHKGFGQHRYTTMVFILLWASIQIFLSLRSSQTRVRAIAWAGIALAVLAYVPRNVRVTRVQARSAPEPRAMERDLQQLGTERLQGQIQCLDIVDGCLTALYHLGIVQSNGSTGDLLLFLPQRSWVVDQARATFWQEIHATPPEVLLLSNMPFGGTRTFGIVNTWPEFAAYLAQDYVLVGQREFGAGAPTSQPGSDPDYPAYRIYLRRGSTLLGAMPPVQPAPVSR